MIGNSTEPAADPLVGPTVTPVIGRVHNPGWFVAWKTVLIHVPLVQDICGLRKKPAKPKPRDTHRLTRLYNSNPALRRNSSNADETS
ncbi:hypothetical protein MUK42_37459 [Musa troglodytarum]|uniref:Uncharacterized protein n=1 Tax=Musa troglodytarum TaxID=320322 RepID=A0A9E7L1I2_9LILI|nr:hypothetical protein MUK42_37459 [Musa troglodytarum]URE40477.1 hypothetical protein MUK42_37459 [Musa troglodytarum]